jgi:exopolysaccharide biosynthesis polyprenyl glycosylphosphotransferase
MISNGDHRMDSAAQSSQRGQQPGFTELDASQVARSPNRPEAFHMLPFFDVAIIWLSALIAVCGRDLAEHSSKSSYSFGLPELKSTVLLLIHSLFLVPLPNPNGLSPGAYPTTLVQQLLALGRPVSFAALIIAAAMFCEGAQPALYVVAAATILLSWFAMAGWRCFLKAQSIPGLTDKRNVVIVGTGPLGVRLRKHIEENPKLGFVFCGFVDRRWKKNTSGANEGGTLRCLGTVDQLPAITRAHFIDEILAAVPGEPYLIREISNYARQAGVALRLVPEISEEQELGLPVHYVGNFPTMALLTPVTRTVQLIVKRLFDFIVSAAVLVFLSPLLMIVAILVKMTSKGPVLYPSVRVGRKGKTFFCYKFRTMVQDAESRKASLEHLNERDGIFFKISADPRITWLGRILRKFSLDEFPQLFNVIKGDMSLVGPRPPTPNEYQSYALEYLRRLDVTPGVTGLWQVTARRCPSFENYMRLDREYVETWSLWLDCKILWKTIGVTLAGTGE